MRYHTIARSLPRIVLAALALLTLAAGLAWSGQPTPARAAPNCPADRSHLIPWRGGRWFLSGVNVAWQRGGFGADFSTWERGGGQHTYSSAATNTMFAELKAGGANSVRWWLFADGRGAPEFDSATGGFVTGFDAATLPAMADAIKLAERHNIYITFTLWSFDMLAAGSNGAGNHRDLIVDPAKRASYIERAITSMLKYPVPGTPYMIGTHPNVLSWEVINEPEWGIREAGAVHHSIREPVSLAEMQRFIAETAGAIHRNSNQLVTVGAAAMKWNTSAAPGSVGNWYSDAALRAYDPQGQLDYYQVHYYEWTNGDGVSWTYSPMKVGWPGVFDKPVVVGEYPANAAGAGIPLLEMLNRIYGNCYAGAWGWTYEGVDSNGNWATMRGPITQFSAGKADVLNIGGSALPAPTVAPPTATAAPAQPTAPPSQPTPPPTSLPSGSGRVIYDDALADGWQNWSWRTRLVLNDGTVIRQGRHAIAVTYESPYAGLKLHASKPLPFTGVGAIRFWLHGGTQGGQVVRLYTADASGVPGPMVTLPALAANTWTPVEVSLTSLGSPSEISDFVLQEAGGPTGHTFYLDELALISTASGPPSGPGSGQEIFVDSLAAGWVNWSWNARVALDSEVMVQSGHQAIAVTYHQPWAGLKLHHDQGLPTSGLRAVRFWVHGGARGGQAIQLYVLNGNGWMSPQVRLPSLAADRWTLVEVPLAQLGSPPRITDLILHERNGPHRDTFFVDAIGLTP